MNNLNNYFHWLKNQCLSPSTIRSYSWAVKQYGSLELNTANIISFFQNNSSKYQPATLRNQRNGLHSYAQFLKKAIEWKKVAKVIPTIQPKFYTTLNLAELEKLKKISWKANFSKKDNQRINERNNLILDFLFYSGLRVGELINIKHSDWQGNCLRVHGKGNKVRYVFLPDFLIKHFKPYSKDYLFLTRKGGKLKDVQIRTIIKRKVERAGIIKKITPHTFRRSLATNLYNKGGKLETIQKQLGHKSLDTTMGYIHNDFNTLYKDYSKLWLNSGGNHA